MSLKFFELIIITNACTSCAAKSRSLKLSTHRLKHNSVTLLYNVKKSLSCFKWYYY